MTTGALKRYPRRESVSMNCGIAERLSHLLNRRIQTVFEVDERVGSPELFAQFLACRDIPVALEQRREQLTRLLLERNPLTTAKEVPELLVERKRPELQSRTHFHP